MNIKISLEEHQRLLPYMNHKILMGSHLYGTQTKSSDKDYLCIYELPETWKSMEWYPNQHQFQYDDETNNTDFIWTDEMQFMRNLYNGDSTINADVVLFTGLFYADMNDRLLACRTYKIIRAYLGFANRDLKHASKNAKKMFHAIRSIYCAKCLIYDTFPDVQAISEIEVKDGNVNELQKDCNELRQKLNKYYDEGVITTYPVHHTDDVLFSKRLGSNNIKEFRY